MIEGSTCLKFVTRRTMLAEAIGDLVVAHDSLSRYEVTAGTTGSYDDVDIVVFDLDDSEIVSSALAHGALAFEGCRRAGFYDEFTVRQAQMAFEIGVTILIPMTAPCDRIIELLTAPRPFASGTATEGLTRDQLGRLGSLTAREIETIRLLSQGLPVTSIARLMSVAEHTVNSYKRRIYAKLDVQSQVQAVSLASAAGVLDSPAAAEGLKRFGGKVPR